ncbi:type I restriction-modification system subunit M N-terminal domain-containing protein [Haloferula chungangensis]|uniref:Type I restriction-modification system subunit M N-terminal domain-containing protein n=1 Tax=Haloferula chungangensis TaxID=1048331 RepID=A0ABW2L040_9BACT
MHWTEPASSDDSHAELEKRLWDAANSLWANAALKPSEFSPIVLGLIFLRYAETRFAAAAEEIGPSTGRGKIGPNSMSERCNHSADHFPDAGKMVIC